MSAPESWYDPELDVVVLSRATACELTQLAQLVESHFATNRVPVPRRMADALSLFGHVRRGTTPAGFGPGFGARLTSVPGAKVEPVSSMSVAAVAEGMGKSQQWVRKLLRSGALAGHRDGGGRWIVTDERYTKAAA